MVVAGAEQRQPALEVSARTVGVARQRRVDGGVQVVERNHEIDVGFAMVAFELAAAPLEMLAEAVAVRNRESEEAHLSTAHDRFSI